MPLSLSRASATLASAMLFSACDASDSLSQPLVLQVVVESDPGAPLAGVPVRLDGELRGSSDSRGQLETSVRMRVGTTLRIEPECPHGYGTGTDAREIKMRQYSSAATGPPLRVVLICKPSMRVAAFIVRAKRGGGVLVRVDGKEITEVNEDGLAHFTRSAVPGTEILVELDARERRELRPPVISRSFRVTDTHELFVFDAVFEPRSRSSLGIRRRAPITKIE